MWCRSPITVPPGQRAKSQDPGAGARSREQDLGTHSRPQPGVVFSSGNGLWKFEATELLHRNPALNFSHRAPSAGDSAQLPPLPRPSARAPRPGPVCTLTPRAPRRAPTRAHSPVLPWPGPLLRSLGFSARLPDAFVIPTPLQPVCPSGGKCASSPPDCQEFPFHSVGRRQIFRKLPPFPSFSVALPPLLLPTSPPFFLSSAPHSPLQFYCLAATLSPFPSPPRVCSLKIIQGCFGNPSAPSPFSRARDSALIQGKPGFGIPLPRKWSPTACGAASFPGRRALPPCCSYLLGTDGRWRAPVCANL